MVNNEKQQSNPYSTGGGGVIFETRVQAYFTILMLLGGFSPCIPNYPITKIKLQGHYDGYSTDDLIIFSTDPKTGEQAKLLAQIKHEISITERDETFSSVIQSNWNDFKDTNFNCKTDAIALITGLLSKTDINNVLPILEWSRTSENEDEFFIKINTEGFSSKSKKEKFDVFKKQLKKANNEIELSNQELWKFLKVFHIIGYDLDLESGSMLSQILSQIQTFSNKPALDLWSRVVNFVQTNNQSAGTLTLENIPADITDSMTAEGGVLREPKPNMSQYNIIINNYYYSKEETNKSVYTNSYEEVFCPYRGLFHFTHNEAEFFFGREVFIEELIQATKNRNFIPVLGASGSGKSSVVFAGLVPKLQQEGQWIFTYFRPGVDPFYSLAEALVPLYRSEKDSTDQIFQASNLAKLLKEQQKILHNTLNTIHRRNHRHKLLLIIDQFEEIYTICNDLKNRYDFLDSLLNITKYSYFSIVIVITMRADFLDKAISYPSFADLFRDDIKLRAMKREELLNVIEKPANNQGVRFSDGLVNRILDDVGNEPGNLSLLEFSLTELWSRQKDKELTHIAYEDIGKVQGALIRYADEKYNKLDLDKQNQVERIFIQLVCPNRGAEDTRRIATKSELGEEDWSLVTELANDRLVVTSRNASGQETVEIIHEVLINKWTKLQEWMNTNRNFRDWQERLRLQISSWEINNFDKSGLLRGALLIEAENWLQKKESFISLEEKDFVQESRQNQENEENHWRRLYEINLARQLAAQASNLVEQSKTIGHWQERLITQSVLLAVESVKRYHCMETDQVLRKNLSLLACPITALERENIEETVQTTDISFNGDGSLLAVYQSGNTVEIWRYDTNQYIYVKSLNHEKKFSSIDKSCHYNFSISSSFFLKQDYLVTISKEFYHLHGYRYEHNTIWIWEPLSEKLITSKLFKSITDIGFSICQNMIITVLPYSDFDENASINISCSRNRSEGSEGVKGVKANQ